MNGLLCPRCGDDDITVGLMDNMHEATAYEYLSCDAVNCDAEWVNTYLLC